MVNALRNFELSDPDVGQLRCLLHGPVGAGKSSFINSVNNVFQGRSTHNALASAATGTSFTMKYKTHYIQGHKGEKRLPFAFNDVMVHPLSDQKEEYIQNPSLSDKTHCLVSIVTADKISLMHKDVIDKMKHIRAEASKLEIPQIVVMTMPDKACELVNRNMQICSNELGVPMNCILPVKNYHEEGRLDNDMDILILNAITQIMNFANDYLCDLQQHA
ncbi:unnamed protein product, partial [Coregonus sp. 'balchen']